MATIDTGGKKRKRDAEDDVDEQGASKSARIPACVPNPVPVGKKKVIVVMTRAYLETAKTKKVGCSLLQYRILLYCLLGVRVAELRRPSSCLQKEQN